ncbi:MAG: hypothetical protein WB699_02275, partial [Bacteroidota bacterium]
IAGKYEELVGRLQEKYGIANEQSRHQVDDFKKVVVQLKKSNAKLMTLQSRLRNAKSTQRKMKPMKSTGTTSRPQTRVIAH